jgi:immunoglobulin-like protein involved in spore germination
MDPRDSREPDLDKRLRSALAEDGTAEPPPDDAWRRLDSRLGRERWRRAAFGGLTLAVIAALAFVVIPRLDLGRRGGAGLPAGPVSPTPSAAPAQDAVFPALYPVTTLADARRLQESVDNGHQPLVVDPKEVARQFARDYIGWQRVEIGAETRTGSAEQGWKATVELRPYIGEANPPSMLGSRHVVAMIGLEGAQEPTWFVTGITSDNLGIDATDRPVSATSPLHVSGKGVGFEGSVLTEIRDDKGTVLHPRPGRNEGHVQAGATAPAPFDATLAFDPPKTPGGVLILRSSSGLDAPAPDWTIVRLSFPPTA